MLSVLLSFISFSLFLEIHLLLWIIIIAINILVLYSWRVYLISAWCYFILKLSSYCFCPCADYFKNLIVKTYFKFWNFPYQLITELISHTIFFYWLYMIFPPFWHFFEQSKRQVNDPVIWHPELQFLYHFQEILRY